MIARGSFVLLCFAPNCSVLPHFGISLTLPISMDAHGKVFPLKENVVYLPHSVYPSPADPLSTFSRRSWDLKQELLLLWLLGVGLNQGPAWKFHIFCSQLLLFIPFLCLVLKQS